MAAAVGATYMVMEAMREAREQEEFSRRCALRPEPYTQVPQSPYALGGCKGRRENFQVWLCSRHQARTLETKRQTLVDKVRLRVDRVAHAYARADLYATLGAAAGLKRSVHELRVVLRTCKSRLPLPSRGSQWRGLAADPCYRDVMRAEELRAWAGVVGQWCRRSFP